MPSSSTPLAFNVIIPIAGNATRMFPASLVTPKSLFPIYNPVTKKTEPILLIILNQIREAFRLRCHLVSLHKIAIVVSEWQLPFVQQFFHNEERLRLYEKKSPEAVEQIRYFAQRLEFVVQKEQKGYGHAVLQTKEVFHDSKENPILISLGDHVYIGTEGRHSCPEKNAGSTSRNCMLQLIDGYLEMRQKLKHFDAITSIDYCTEKQLSTNGILTGDLVSERVTGVVNTEDLIVVTDTIEKPSLQEARQKLFIEDESHRNRLKMPLQTSYLCYFGIEILPYELFAHLEKLLKELPEDEELNLRIAQHGLIHREDSGMAGLLMKGKRLDTGLPFEYLQSMNEFYNNQKDER